MTQHVSQRPVEGLRRKQTRAKACVGACAPATNLFLFLTALVRKLSLLGSLGRIEGSLKRHGQDSDDDGAIDLLSVSSRSWVASLGSRAVGRIDLVENLGLRPPWLFMRLHRRGTLCYGL